MATAAGPEDVTATDRAIEAGWNDTLTAAHIRDMALEASTGKLRRPDTGPPFRIANLETPTAADLDALGDLMELADDALMNAGPLRGPIAVTWDADEWCDCDLHDDAP